MAISGAAVSAIVGAISVAATVASTVIQSESAADAAEFEAEVRQADGIRNAARVRRARRRELAQQRAQLGGSGLEVSGSPLAALVSNAAEYELEARDVERGAAVGSALAKSRARNSRTAGAISGTSQAIGGGLRVAALA